MNEPFADTEPSPSIASRSSRGPSNTLLISLVIVVLAIVVCVKSGSWLTVNKEVILRMGANAPQATLDRWGLWRLLAAKLLTSSALALVPFLAFFAVVSSAFERRYGRAVHLVFFVLASALTSTATIFLRHDESLASVGAGGPALAMGACLLVAMLLRLDGAPHARDLLSWKVLLVGPFLALTMSGLVTGNADWASLLGGVVVGVAAGVLVPTAMQVRRGESRRGAFLGALLSIAIVAAGCVAAPQPRYYLSELDDFIAQAPVFTAEMDALNRRVEALTDQAMEGNLSREQLADRMRAEVLPAWQKAHAKWVPMYFNPAMPGGDKIAPMKDYVVHRLAFLTATTRGWATDNADAWLEAAQHKIVVEKARAAMAAAPDQK